MLMRTIGILFFLIILTQLLNAQNGTLRGIALDEETAEPIMFASVYIPEIESGTTTDLDGAFSVDLAPGNYTIELTYVGYAKSTISDVVIKSGEVNNLDIRMGTASEVLQEVVVEAKQLRNTEAALATIKRKSVNVIDGISAASFKKMGDGNAAAAVKRVPGVSLIDGKYVYVRGLGDRYTKSVLNGMDIPGLDPDRNTLQMDIFPTNVIDNIIVLKSFTADLPADFTGGIVNIETKAFPEDRQKSLSLGIGYNPDMHFKSDYINYDGGALDFLGIEDGTREIPTDRRTNIPQLADAISDVNINGPKSQEYREILNGFNKNLAAEEASSLMDISLGYSMGNQFNKDDKTVGYNFAVTYKNSTDFYQDAQYSQFGRQNQSNQYELEQRQLLKGKLGENNVLLGTLLGFNVKKRNNKYGVTLLHLQNGEKKTALFNYEGTNQGANFNAIQHNLEFSQKMLTNLLINGRHSLKEGLWDIDWRISPTRSSLDDPDIRYTRYRVDQGRITIGTESGIPERIWRYLEEYSLNSKVDLTRDMSVFERDAKLKFGVLSTVKYRDYEIQNFQISTNQTVVTEDINLILNEENLWSAENRNGVTYDPTFLPNNPNAFSALARTEAGYVQTELNPFNRFKTILGLRFENYTQLYTGINQNGDEFDLEEVLSDVDLFPSVNLIYNLRDNQNVRLSYSNTIARPSLKEASYATILDPVSGRTFIGGFFPDIDVETGEEVWDGNLSSTRISNFDLRYELFLESGQTVSLSGFYKQFTDPIEIVQYVQAQNNFQPRNVGNGEVLGAELELRHSLGIISPALRPFMLNANLTVVESSIDMSESEYRSRVDNARDGQTIERTRSMAGQAPYLINTGLAYQNTEKGLDIGAYYNVQGETLIIVGVVDRPDIYSDPFHSLNLTASKSFGENRKYRIDFKAENILGDETEEFYSSFQAENQIFTLLAPMRTYSLGFAVKL